MSVKNPLTPAGIEPATYRFVAQHLNRCATAVPCMCRCMCIIIISVTLYESALGGCQRCLVRTYVRNDRRNDLDSVRIKITVHF